MIKKTILLTLLTVPSFAMAQSEWSAPVVSKQKVENTDKENKKNKAINPKYGVGTVPTVEGKVEWTYEVSLPGKSTEAIYERAIEVMTDMTKLPGQSEKSRLTAVNKKEHIIAGYYDEELVFSSKLLARDFTDFRYTIIATAKEGKLAVRICRMSYAYEMNRSTGSIYPAEELITDENCMNKKHTKFFPMTGKFRIKTIDRKDEIFATFEQKMKE